MMEAVLSFQVDPEPGRGTRDLVARDQAAAAAGTAKKKGKKVVKKRRKKRAPPA